MKQNGLPILVDELAEDTRLLWIGKQGTDRVILYFHGTYYLCLIIARLLIVSCRRRISVPHVKLHGVLLEIFPGRAQEEKRQCGYCNPKL